MEFWDWALKQEAIKPEVFSGFGFWINPHKEVFDMKWLAIRVAETLKRSRGDIDWDYALTKQLNNFAKCAPNETLQITERYFLNDSGTGLNLHRKSWLHVDQNEKEAITILYENPNTSAGVLTLISKLLEIGSAPFWELETIVTK